MTFFFLFFVFLISLIIAFICGRRYAIKTLSHKLYEDLGTIKITIGKIDDNDIST